MRGVAGRRGGAAIARRAPPRPSRRAGARYGSGSSRGILDARDHQRRAGEPGAGSVGRVQRRRRGPSHRHSRMPALQISHGPLRPDRPAGAERSERVEREIVRGRCTISSAPGQLVRRIAVRHADTAQPGAARRFESPPRILDGDAAAADRASPGALAAAAETPDRYGAGDGLLCGVSPDGDDRREERRKAGRRRGSRRFRDAARRRRWRSARAAAAARMNSAAPGNSTSPALQQLLKLHALPRHEVAAPGRRSTAGRGRAPAPRTRRRRRSRGIARSSPPRVSSTPLSPSVC